MIAIEDTKLTEFIAGLLNGEQWALSRAITNIENDTEIASKILMLIQTKVGQAGVVGITGPPGVGKSTLIDALIKELRKRNKTVGILAVDPSSPFSGGAILGDRIRMAGHADDPGVFIRSLASRGHLGGLIEPAFGVIQVMDASGYDFILVETVGAGQSEVEIADLADVKIVVCAPGLGDEVQAIKAGILEIADILVVNKSDQPRAQDTVDQLKGMLRLRKCGREDVAIISTSAMQGKGVLELIGEIDRLKASRRGQIEKGANRRNRYIRRVLAENAVRSLRQHIQLAQSDLLEGLCAQIASGQIGFSAAAQELLNPILTSQQIHSNRNCQRKNV